MDQIFLSYKREDELRVSRLVNALLKAGFSVWWDKALPGGEEWRRSIEETLNRARIVIVVWSKASVSAAGEFVRDEASRAKSAGKLVPVRIDRVESPLGFGELQCIDLSHWGGSARDPYFQDLAAVLKAKLDGRPAPPSKAPAARLARRLFVGSATSAIVGGGALFGLNVWKVQDHLCTAPIFQPVLSDACGAIHIGSRPSRDERVDWESLAKGSCDSLRGFVQRYPDGAMSEQALALLKASRTRVEESWSPAELPLALYGSSAMAVPSADDEEARAAALSRALPSAKMKCEGYSQTGEYRLIGTRVESGTWQCASVQGGRVCSFDGQAICSVERRDQRLVEECG